MKGFLSKEWTRWRDCGMKFVRIKKRLGDLAELKNGNW